MKSPLAMIIAIVVLYSAFNSFFIITEGKQAIVTQFGKPVDKPIRKAGIFFKIPLIQKVLFFEKRIIKWDGEKSEISTNDKTFIWVDTTARWQIEKPLVFYKSLNNEVRANAVLNGLINGAVRDFIQENDLIEIIRSSDWKLEYTATKEESSQAGNQSEKPVKLGRDQFSQLVQKEVQRKTKNLGVKILDVLIKRVNYIDTVRETVYNRMISERKQKASNLRSLGAAEQAKILGEMNKELDRISSGAYRKSQELRGDADAKATLIYAGYKKDPEFYKFYTTLEAYRKSLGKNTRIILDSKADFFKLLKTAK
ncbi:MAG: membrane protease subunit HflC [bacterium]|jgi:membrane protease subunit HflC